MLITSVSPETWPRLRKRVLAFVANYKDRHITPETNSRLRSLTGDDLAGIGSIVLLATEQNRLLGVLACKEHGQDFSLAVVRKAERSKGVGKELLRRAIAELGKFHVEIASDNVPSLKLAFACGLRAHSVFVRDTGKVVLRLKTDGPQALALGLRERNTPARN
ncbi:MAG: Uncharacterized protein FD169_107 [Bacillota bacterium]|nr:MAG: Uncharacterized protein FD169_107 [Bacillota bacterium]MBS3949066.1 GNAT family N-acetyltransferase [Peptococcaceae bacterium]